MPSLVAALSLVVSPVHVTLVFAPDNRLRPALERYALSEAAAIWAPYGVVVTASDEGCASEQARPHPVGGHEQGPGRVRNGLADAARRR